MTTGERIKARRQELGWTLDDLADKADISKTYLWELERNQKNVGAEILRRIGVALSLTLVYLMDGMVDPIQPRDGLPASLHEYAHGAGLPYRQVISLHAFWVAIRLHHSGTKHRHPEAFDWQKLHLSVKEWL